MFSMAAARCARTARRACLPRECKSDHVIEREPTRPVPFERADKHELEWVKDKCDQ
jgi:hypothetical protein